MGLDTAKAARRTSWISFSEENPTQRCLLFPSHRILELESFSNAVTGLWGRGEAEPRGGGRETERVKALLRLLAPHSWGQERSNEQAELERALFPVSRFCYELQR